jgi:hypothetical protein
MSAQLGSRRFRYTIRGLMILVAVVAVALTWVLWTQRPKPFPVSGTITYNGQPLGNGKIVFLPPTAAGRQATGQVINGKYSLTSFTLNDGALSGSYKIIVVSPSVPARYQSQATSGLVVQIQKSVNMIDLNLR